MKKGFTLVELLIVIGILGTLAVMVLIAINPMAQLAKVRNAQRKTDLRTVADALKRQLTITGSYPSTGGAWWGETIYGSHGQGYIPGLITSGELKMLPTDPKPDEGVCAPGSRGYLYRSNGSCYKFLAWCTPESPPAEMNDPTDPFRDPNRSTHSWMVCAPEGSACCSW